MLTSAHRVGDEQRHESTQHEGARVHERHESNEHAPRRALKRIAES
jgi:hypothetical protein